MKADNFGPRVSDEYRARAAFYALYLRQACGYAPDEAAALVIERYPRVRAELERLTRRRPVDPLAGGEEASCAS